MQSSGNHPPENPAIGNTADGFWLVKFTGTQGMGRGVVTLLNGRLFGGDSGYLYTGSYRQQGTELEARIEVASFEDGAQSVMGPQYARQFALILTGRISEKVISASGSIPGTDQAFEAVLLRQILPL